MGLRFPELDQKNSARVAVTTGHTSQGEKSMAVSNIPDELAEARERADAGIRLAMPQFAERVGIGTEPEQAAIMEAKVAEAISDRLGAARQELVGAMKLADVADDRVLHIDLAERVNGLDDLGAVLAERWAS